jgi:serine/threonine-protein kinase
MNPTGSPDDVTCAPAVHWQVNEACDRFESALEAGEHPQIESLTADYPHLRGPDLDYLQTELLKAELTHRQKAGHPLSPESYRKRFPDRVVAVAFAQWRTSASTDEEFDTSFRQAMEKHPSLQILDLINRGGMGRVYLAYQRTIKRQVALKVIQCDISNPALVGRFEREIEAAGKLKHNNIVMVYDALFIDNYILYIMDFINGIDLGRKVSSEGPLRFRTACDYIRQAAEGMHYAYSVHSLIHRDIKPQNLILADGTIKIIDFGLARFIHEGTSTLSRSVVHAGTPDFMAPEQARDFRAATVRSDIYSLGCTLYYLLTASSPYPRGTMAQKIAAHMNLAVTPAPLTSFSVDVPRGLQEVLGRMMAKEPGQRYNTPAEVSQELEPFTTSAREEWNIPINLDSTATENETAREVDQPRSWSSPRAILFWLVLPLVVVPVSIYFSISRNAHEGKQETAPGERPLPGIVRSASRSAEVNSVGMTMVLIPAGQFHMGWPESDENSPRNQQPQHLVRITRPFRLAAHEVTQGQYRAVTGASPSVLTGADDLPVENVSWFDALAFCNELSRMEGLKPFYVIDGSRAHVPDWNGMGYRLPIEAEWEYACRAGSATRYCFGDDEAALAEYAWYVVNSGKHTHGVGQKLPNAWGLYDLHGNVAEWCWDGYEARYYHQSPGAVPFDPANASDRILRGGSAFRAARDCWSTYRGTATPDLRDLAAGLRVARAELQPAPGPSQASEGHRRQ